MKVTRSRSILLAYYGDDFTGSTDVLEALAVAGLKATLFLHPPSAAQLAKFPGLQAFGIAGGARAMTPAQMEDALPCAFRALKASGARFVHYKTCSTFDSSPRVGSIGKAIELGRRVFGQFITPLVVGVPVLGRYVVFGTLFARSGLDTEPFRLDRHPTMSRHPVTPMDEAEVRLHLAKQTTLPVTLVDVLKLEAERVPPRLVPKGSRIQALMKSWGARHPPPIVLFDTLHEADLSVIGGLIASQRPPHGSLFCAGSSGVEYALVAHWRETGRVPNSVTPDLCSIPNRGQIIIVSGSCSPVTDRQIALAVKKGFVEIACETGRLADRTHRRQAITRALARGHAALAAGRHVIFHTARGPADSRRPAFERVARMAAGPTWTAKLARAGAALGESLGQILEEALRLSGVRRAIVCGGDTATAVAGALGIEALEFVAPTAPGAPLCRVHAPGRVVHGCEVVFKGGQVGHDTFFLDFIGCKSP